MKDFEFNDLINKIDNEIARLEGELYSQEIKSKKKSKKKSVKQQKPIDRTKQALDAIKECVNEILEIDNLEESRNQDLQYYNNRNLTIVSWFYYLKRQKPNTKEYEEAKELILSIGKKHKKLEKWCEELVNEPIEYNE